MPNIGAPSRVTLQLLGGFRVVVDGEPVAADAWPNRRAAHLVQLLALAPGGRLLREQAIEALWPQLSPQAGSANLRKAAHHARRVLGRDDAVVLHTGQVMLFPSGDVVIDHMRFERLAADALASRDEAACLAAADAYGGDLLPEAAYEPWSEAERARLRATWLEVLRAGRLWERVALAEPTDEDAHRELMRAAIASGSRALAIRWYGRLREALERSLGVTPTAQTERLYDACVASLAFPSPALVGRQWALAQAAAVLRAAPDRRPGGLVIRGAAGIGKTALLRRCTEGARDEAWHVVSVSATRAEAPYAIVVSAVEQVLRDERTALDAIGEPARAVLAHLTPLAGTVAPSATPLARQQVIGAFRRLLLALERTPSARPPSVMLAVDDAHLADEASADVLLHLVASGRPVLVTLAMRDTGVPDALAAGIARLSRGGMLASVDLEPLAREDALALVREAAPAPLAPARAERVVSLGAGNPFALLELARHAAEGRDAALGEPLREAIAQRLCEVDADTRAFLERLALAGERFDTATAIAMAGSEAQACTQLDRALDARIVLVSDGAYRFRHELVRQALVEGLAPHRRAAVHREAAERLGALGAPPGVVARRWLDGGRPEQAVPWLLDAARDARRLGAFRDCLEYLAPLLAQAPEHAEAACLKADALDALGDPSALVAYDRAVERTSGVAAHDLRAKRALAQVKLGDPAGALRALHGVTPVSVEGRLAEALAYSGAAALGFGDPAVGARKSEECRRLALQTGDSASLVVASWSQAAAAHARGELHKTVWRDLHDTHALPHLAVSVFDGQLCITQRFLYGARPYAEVIAFADALAAEARRLGAARGHAFAVTIRGEAKLLAGQLDAAEVDLVEGARLHRAIGGATGEAFSLQRRAEAAMYRGHRGLARDLLDEALDIARQSDIGFHLLDRIYGTRIALAEDADAALSAVEDGEAAVRGPLETCPGCRITFAVPAVIGAARAHALDVASRHERAADYLANVVMKLPAWDAALLEARAHMSLARGANEQAAAGFAAASEGFARAGQPLDARRCQAHAVQARVTA